jgi:hypothetical protein
MTGGDGDDFLQGLLGVDTLLGQGDDDVLIGDTTVGAFGDDLSGGDGNDQLAGFDGDDTLDGGAGNDVLGTIDFSRAGGPATVERGDDTLIGGEGNDMLLAGPGNDRLEARDGTADTVDCGEESNGAVDADVAIVDQVDTVVDCETVSYPDTTAPKTRITDGPADVIKTRKRKVGASFAFKSSEEGSTFECKLDKAPFTACTSPTKVTLSRGEHVFKVRATDAAGNVDQTPATRQVTVKGRRG